MTETKFHANDEVSSVVMLRSGGPHMTVVASEADGLVCVWFAQDGSFFGPKLFDRRFLVVVMRHSDVTESICPVCKGRIPAWGTYQETFDCTYHLRQPDASAP